jgi:CTP synthase (UTP-ammonia lyase)
MRIALLGDFDGDARSHWATEAALSHAAVRLGLTVEPCWISTAALAAAHSTARPAW